MSMIQENKRLLLADLSARLPYRVIVHIHDINVDDYDRQLTGEDLDLIELDKRNCKPYLRPMSSMTEEECKELGELPAIIEHVGETLPNVPYYIEVVKTEQIDYLNANHFDYRDLISKGLALKAPEGMYEIQD